MFYRIPLAGLCLVAIVSTLDVNVEQISKTTHFDYKINKKPCSVNGLEGTCMFVYECIYSNGRHIGVCVDMSDSCCAHNLTSQMAMLRNSSELAASFTQPGGHGVSQKPIRPHHQPHRPSQAMMRPTTTSTTIPPPPSTSVAVPSSTYAYNAETTVSAATATSASRPEKHTAMPSVSAETNQKSILSGSAPLHPRHEVRIVGGSNAAFSSWPWQVAVRSTSFFSFPRTYRCGGALLNENWIATAAHCVVHLSTSKIRIRVGEYDFSTEHEPYKFAERAVAKMIVHPKFNLYTLEYDLAMVRLDSPLQYAPHIVPICLPGSDDLLIGEIATVTGWGRLSEEGTLPPVLQEVNVPIVSNDKCESMHLTAGQQENIPEIFMCAGFDDGGRDSCQGDSGGPLQVKDRDGRYFLAGISSWGNGCAKANRPGVYTRISKFVPWILETVT